MSERERERVREKVTVQTRLRKCKKCSTFDDERKKMKVGPDQKIKTDSQTRASTLCPLVAVVC